MGENSPHVEGIKEELATTDTSGVAMKIQRAKGVYKACGGIEDKPTKGEILGWHLYGLCSYFVHTVLIPIVFPLIISQTVSTPPEPNHGWSKSYKGLQCNQGEMKLYEGLIHRSIEIGNMNLSPLDWTSISWGIGLIFAAPVLAILSIHLDYGQKQQLISGAATAIGALFCLPAGFLKKSWIFPPYIAAIVAANTTGAACHARHLGLMIRGFIGPTIRKGQFPDRRAFASWLSLYSTSAGSLGSAIISAFTYHMLRKTDNFTSLWVVSIFSGLKWGAGLLHIFTSHRPGWNINNTAVSSSPKMHVFSIFKYPHAAGSLAGVFLSSFTTMCIFTGGILYAIGYLCLEPIKILYIWLTYFLSPLITLPLSHPLQQMIKADAVKMQLLGFFLSTLTCGFGFYYQKNNWRAHHVLVFSGVQATATGLLHAYGRVLWLDCSPLGKEGAFSVWFSWVRAVGACMGFGFGAGFAGEVGKAFGVAFCAGVLGMVILIFGNISSFGGAKAAGNVTEYSPNVMASSPVQGLDHSVVETAGSSQDVASQEKTHHQV